MHTEPSIEAGQRSCGNERCGGVWKHRAVTVVEWWWREPREEAVVRDWKYGRDMCRDGEFPSLFDVEGNGDDIMVLGRRMTAM
ncbi:hypothetical protein NL676_007610 [Syzygium grande]|nr:hypothetical protein NL676_007610 [Syzygium grande]